MNLVFLNIMAELNIFSVFPISDTYDLPSGDNIFDFIKGVVLTSAGNSIPMAGRSIESQPLKFLWIDCASDVNVEVRYQGEIQYKGRVASDGFYFENMYYDEVIIITTATTATQVIGSSSSIGGVGGSGGTTGADIETVEADIDGKEAITANALGYGRTSTGVTVPIDASPANTARTTATVVQVTQHVGANGSPMPSGIAADPIFVDINNDAEVATTPTVYNVTMTSLDTEYSQALPANTKIISFRCQDPGFAVRYAYETGKVAASTPPFRNLFAGEERTVEGLNLTSKTLYLACSTAAKVMEIECWS